MAEIRSRVTLEHIVRKSILVIIVVVFAAYYAYDGYLGYPKRNLQQAIRGLDPKPPALVTFSRSVTRDSTAWIKEGIKLQEVVDRLGPPAWANERKTEAQYFGPALVLKLTAAAGQISRVEHISGPLKSEFDLRVQKSLALVLTLIAVPLLVHHARVLTYTARLTDRGLKLSGKPFVPFEGMKSIDASRYKDKGWLDIAYRLDPTEGALRLDEYWIKDFKRILAEICQRTGLPNPLEPLATSATTTDQAPQPDAPSADDDATRS